jgi:alpha-tubulin suppressor-like RCC1 family protein
MSRVAGKYLLLLAVITAIAIVYFYSGCSTGFYDEFSSTGNNGSLIVRIKAPRSNSSVRSRIIPFGTTDIRITITGENGFSYEQDFPFDSQSVVNETISGIPPGLHVATFKAVEKVDGMVISVLAQRKHSFFMPAVGIVGPSTVDLGVAIENGFAVPDTITIEQGETLYFQNWDNTEREVILKKGSNAAFHIDYQTGSNLPGFEVEQQPNTPATYHFGSYQFNEHGTYIYQNNGGGNNTETYKIVVTPSTAVVSGLVTDSVTGVPIANATVTIGEHSTDTDADGRYTFGAILANTYNISAQAANYVTYNNSIEIIYPATEHNIQLVHITGTLSGKVTAGTSTIAVAGVTVSAGGRTTTTDANGDYTLNNVPIGTRTITAATPGYVPSSTNKLIEASPASNIQNIALGIFMSIKSSDTGDHTIALDHEGNIWAWGKNNLGQLGIGNNTNQPFPVKLNLPAGMTNVTSIGAGEELSIAVAVNGTVWTWGTNLYGQLGRGTTGGSQNQPVQVLEDHNATQADGPYLTGIISVAAGQRHVVALASDGEVYIWGNNFYGMLGINDPETNLVKNTPVHVSTLSGITQIASGRYFSLALKNNGKVYGWGYNQTGELGQGAGNTSDKFAPVELTVVSDIVSISAGRNFSMAVASDGKIYSCGQNNQGQLGRGTYSATATTANPTPALVIGLSGINIIRVSGGEMHALAIASNGDIYSWGINSNGQLGDGLTERKHTPAKILSLDSVLSISAGRVHSTAIKKDGTIWTWGKNDTGQLGSGVINDPTQRETPASISDFNLLPD